MYNGGFGAYPQDDMGVNSYFGESDTNFFGDTSNDSFFGEGCGFTGIGNGEFFNESVGFSTDGSEVISESYGMGYGYSDMFMESGDNKKDGTEGKFSDDPELNAAKKKSDAKKYGDNDPGNPTAARKRLRDLNYPDTISVNQDVGASGLNSNQTFTRHGTKERWGYENPELESAHMRGRKHFASGKKHVDTNRNISDHLDDTK